MNKGLITAAGIAAVGTHDTHGLKREKAVVP